MPSRRHVLGTVAAGLCVSLAGRTDPAGVLQMGDATPDEIVDAVTYRVEPRPTDQRTLLDELAQNGSATSTVERQPLHTDRPVTYGGAVYELAVSRTGDRTRTDYRIRLEFDSREPDGTERPFEGLPAVDTERLEPLLERRNRSDIEAVSTAATYTEPEREASVLVPEPEVDSLLVDGVRVDVVVDSVETTVTTYEYTLADELGSVEAYADRLETAYRFDLSGLSSDEADVVDEAIEAGGYYASSTDDEAFEGVARTLFEHDPLASTDDEGHWLVTYEGSTYVAMLDPVRYESLRNELPRTPKRTRSRHLLHPRQRAGPSEINTRL